MQLISVLFLGLHYNHVCIELTSRYGLSVMAGGAVSNLQEHTFLYSSSLSCDTRNNITRHSDSVYLREHDTKNLLFLISRYGMKKNLHV